MPLDSNPLEDLIEAIRSQHGNQVLAAPEDANYFRTRQKNAERTGVPTNASFLGQGTRNAEVKKVDAPVPKVEIVLKKETPPVVVVAKPRVEEREEPVRVRADWSGVRNVLAVVAPELAILDEIPNDAMAKKISERWKTKNQTAPISILSYQEPGAQRELLEGVARALDVYFGPAKVVSAEAIERGGMWETFLSVEGLKMIVVCDYTLWQLRGLMQFYKETPAQGARMLGNVPIFLLPDLSLYLKDPLLKRSLWKALCQKFS